LKRFECSAIIFDLDGVLVDSAAFVEQQWRRWATARGLRAEPFLRVCHGRRAVETIRLAAPQLDAEAEVRAFVPQGDAGEEPIGAGQGAERLLQSLPSDTWGVATSGLRPSATARLRRAGLPVPAVLVCAEDVARGKPNPDPYLIAAGLLEVPPHSCLVVEDSPAGIEGARAAGMPVVGLTTTHELEPLSADALATSLRDVHIGRMAKDVNGRWRLEVLVVDP
jgi:sugar-phosphatase